MLLRDEKVVKYYRRDIHLHVREWHESASPESLAEYLGMTDEEYASWVENPGVLKNIVASRMK